MDRGFARALTCVCSFASSFGLPRSEAAEPIELIEATGGIGRSRGVEDRGSAPNCSIVELNCRGCRGGIGPRAPRAGQVPTAPTKPSACGTTPVCEHPDCQRRADGKG